MMNMVQCKQPAALYLLSTLMNDVVLVLVDSVAGHATAVTDYATGRGYGNCSFANGSPSSSVCIIPNATPFMRPLSTGRTDFSRLGNMYIVGQNLI